MTPEDRMRSRTLRTKRQLFQRLEFNRKVMQRSYINIYKNLAHCYNQFTCYIRHNVNPDHMPSLAVVL